jgi:hypothetical protein
VRVSKIEGGDENQKESIRAIANEMKLVIA